MPIITQSGRFKDELESKPATVTEEHLEDPKKFKDRYSPTNTSPDGFLADLTPTVSKTSFRHASPYFFNSPRSACQPGIAWVAFKS